VISEGSCDYEDHEVSENTALPLQELFFFSKTLNNRIYDKLLSGSVSLFGSVKSTIGGLFVYII